MTSTTQSARISSFGLDAIREDDRPLYEAAYERHRRRVYGLAFWMTGNERAAERVSAAVFCRAFARTASPTAEAVDGVLVAELRSSMALGRVTLDCPPAVEVLGVRHNILRPHLERAVLQLPATERLLYLLHDGEGYSHARIATLLGMREQECVRGLHQARLRLRQLLAAMR
jgi:RNA polymerase sigma-70 factor (ECF subfamily)